MKRKSVRHGAAAALGVTLMFTACVLPASEVTVTDLSTTKAQPDDVAISQQVAALISADQRIRGTRLEISTSHGIVSLSGRVETVAMIYRTIELARRVNGVRAVNDDGLIQASY
jgi:osmotically-inducible protein OsmY